MLTTVRRSLAFRRKTRHAGLRIVGRGLLTPERVLWVREDQPSAMPITVFESPHLHLLKMYQRLGDYLWPCFHQTMYAEWQRSMRGYQHPRPDEWIEAMGRRLVRLYESIKTDGYRCRSVADRIAVRDGVWLWDGGHRLACLVALGKTEVPGVFLTRRTRPQ